MEGFILLFTLVICPVAWCIAKWNYNPETGGYRRTPPPLPEPEVETKKQRHTKQHHDWDYDFARAQVAARGVDVDRAVFEAIRAQKAQRFAKGGFIPYD